MRPIFWTAERIYFIKAYFGWWLALALLGSLFANKPSHSFVAAMWNPMIWNIAGLFAFLVAMSQTYYREQLSRFLNHTLVRQFFVTAWFFLQAESIGRMTHKHTGLPVALAQSVFLMFGTCCLINFVVRVYQAINRRRTQKLLSSQAP